MFLPTPNFPDFGMLEPKGRGLVRHYVAGFVGHHHHGLFDAFVLLVRKPTHHSAKRFVLFLHGVVHGAQDGRIPFGFAARTTPPSCSKGAYDVTIEWHGSLHSK